MFSKVLSNRKSLYNWTLLACTFHILMCICTLKAETNYISALSHQTASFIIRIFPYGFGLCHFGALPLLFNLYSKIQLMISFALDKYSEVCLLDPVVVLLKVLKSPHIVFLSSPTNRQSHQQFIAYAFSPHPYQHFLCFILLIIPILTGMRW